MFYHNEVAKVILWSMPKGYNERLFQKQMRIIGRRKKLNAEQRCRAMFEFACLCHHLIKTEYGENSMEESLLILANLTNDQDLIIDVRTKILLDPSKKISQL